MRVRVTFDFYSHHLRTQHSTEDVAVVTDWATPTTALTSRITWVSCRLLLGSESDPLCMRDVSKVITSTARVADLEWTGNLVAAPRVQAPEPKTDFHIAQSSYRTEL